MQYNHTSHRNCNAIMHTFANRHPPHKELLRHDEDMGIRKLINTEGHAYTKLWQPTQHKRSTAAYVYMWTKSLHIYKHIVCTLVHPQTSPPAAPNKDNANTPPTAEGSTQWRHTCMCNASMVQRPNKAQRMLNILKVSLLLTMNVLITTRHSVILSLWCQRQTFHGQEYNDMRNLPVHTCMHSHPFWSKVVPTCQHYSGYQGLLLQHIIYNIHNM